MSTMNTSAIPPSDSKSWLPAKSSRHFVAGGFGGMMGAIVTSPFDVVKTRLQSSLFQTAPMISGGVATLPVRPPGGLLYNFVETGHILRDIYHNESPRALFKGLGPTLVGVVPARSINFFTYGNGKQLIANKFNDGVETPVVHVSAAALAGITTSICTNPIWVVKTRLQLEQTHRPSGVTSAAPTRGIGGSWAVIRQIATQEGVRGYYKGLSASLLGATEGAIQWTLYEQSKRLSASISSPGSPVEWACLLVGSGASKCIASLVTYPHEVIRTRLRQPLVDGKVKYTGLGQTLRLLIAEEGVRSLYGGLSAHLMRVIPNAAIMFSVYEFALRLD